jgi:uncharacterized protein YecE (DUF72 family)
MMVNIRVGTSGWSYKEWRGTFYPVGLKVGEQLAFYARHLDTTEINCSFYRLPSVAMVTGWRARTPDDFLFAWKASRHITHYRRLGDVAESLRLAFERMQPLGHKLGPALFQVPPSLKHDRELLARFLDFLPPHEHTIEFRHPSWYAADILDLLRGHDVALCVSDHRAAPAPWEATARHVYVRPHGPDANYSGRYDDETLRRWAKHIAEWGHEGRKIYCYFDNTMKTDAPGDAARLKRLLGMADRDIADARLTGARPRPAMALR